MTISDRKFGVEIEFFGVSGARIIRALEKININCIYEEYNHQARSHWKLTTDSSIKNNNKDSYCCWELVSPPLSGETGLKQIADVSAILLSIGAQVNSTCGLHVHVNAKDYSTADLANTIMRYGYFESQIDNLMPKSRKKDNNNYCLSVKQIASLIEENIDNISMLSPAQFVRYAASRYYKLNLLAYLRHGTLEFRQHFGTVNKDKIVNWIKFCINFVENSKMAETSFVEKEFIKYKEENSGCDCSECMFSCPLEIKNDWNIETDLDLDTIKTIEYLNATIHNANSYLEHELSTTLNIDIEKIHCIMLDIRNMYGIPRKHMDFYSGERAWSLNTYIKLSLTAKKPIKTKVMVPVFKFENDSPNKGLEPEVNLYFEQRAKEMIDESTDRTIYTSIASGANVVINIDVSGITNY